DAVMMHDLRGHILAWNRGAERMYGYSEQEALQMNMEDLVPEGERAEARHLMDAIERGEEAPASELRRKTKDGRVLDVWVTTTRLVDEAGRPIALTTVERDITERKRSDAALRRLGAVLRDSNDAITMQDLKGRILAW